MLEGQHFQAIIPRVQRDQISGYFLMIGLARKQKTIMLLAMKEINETATWLYMNSSHELFALLDVSMLGSSILF